MMCEPENGFCVCGLCPDPPKDTIEVLALRAEIASKDRLIAELSRRVTLMEQSVLIVRGQR